MNKKLLVLLAGVVLVAAACNSQPQASTPAPTPSPTTESMPAPSPDVMPSPSPSSMTNVVLKSNASILGISLTGTNDMTLYVYGKDTSGVSNCSGTCATNWPPYTVASADNLAAATGITGKVGTIKRADGTFQVTYNGMPLYFWIKDKAMGDTTGNGIGNFTAARP